MSNSLKGVSPTSYARSRRIISLRMEVSPLSPMETRKIDDGTLWGEGVCTLCGAREFLNFFEVKRIPAQDGVLWSTHEGAVNAPRGDISLSLCLNCGYV